MIICGIDPSLTCTGLARVDTKFPRPHAVTTAVKTKKEMSKLSRMRTVRDEVSTFVRGADLIVVEGLSMASLGSATRDLAGLWWMLYDVCDEWGIVAPSTLKLWATGNGGHAGTTTQQKKRVQAAICGHWSIPLTKTYDEADALALASMGLQYEGELPWRPEPWQMISIKTPIWPVEAS